MIDSGDWESDSWNKEAGKGRTKETGASQKETEEEENEVFKSKPRDPGENAGGCGVPGGFHQLPVDTKYRPGGAEADRGVGIGLSGKKKNILAANCCH